MINSRKVSIFLSVFIWTILFGCSNNKVKFTKQQLRLTIPFQNTETFIYKSGENKSDTITFYKVQYSFSHTSNFSQGFYDTYSYNVNYQLTPNSYHKSSLPGFLGKEESLFHISKSSDNPESTGQEFSFLGLIFDYKFLESISNDTTSLIIFDEKSAQYNGMNINEGIKIFKFQTDKGIVSFIDKNNVEWLRFKNIENSQQSTNDWRN